VEKCYGINREDQTLQLYNTVWLNALNGSLIKGYVERRYDTEALQRMFGPDLHQV
jgi:hypothetical protein